MVFKT